MSSLIPDRQLTLSPALAATIGLEEAVLLHTLTDLVSLRGESDERWHSVAAQQLEALLPFWHRLDLQRVTKSLTDKGVILVDSPPLNRSATLRFAFNERGGSRQSSGAAATKLSMPTRGANYIAPNWMPDEQLLRLLNQNHGIPRDFALAEVEDFVLYWRERAEPAHAWSSKFRQHVLHKWQAAQQHEKQAREKQQHNQALERDWRPSDDAVEILTRDGVNADFINDAIAEFILYWRERGASDATWNTKFIAHIRRQWARYRNALAGDTEPRRIEANWQPAADVFDILELANIDAEFARQLVPEFVLYWRDSGEMQRSWNSKFLQHVKFHWAKRHHLEQTYARQQNPQRSRYADPEGFIQRHTDRSWADGL